MHGYTTASAQGLQELLRQRLVFLDGAMGTMLQDYRLSEEEFRGDLLRDHVSSVQGDHELLTLTQPAIVSRVHREYLEAGADVIQTNTFNANRISQGEYGLQRLVPEINLAAARLARRVADDFHAAYPERPVFVAGALGPT